MKGKVAILFIIVYNKFKGKFMTIKSIINEVAIKSGLSRSIAETHFKRYIKGTHPETAGCAFCQVSAYLTADNKADFEAYIAKQTGITLAPEVGNLKLIRGLTTKAPKAVIIAPVAETVTEAVISVYPETLQAEAVPETVAPEADKAPEAEAAPVINNKVLDLIKSKAKAKRFEKFGNAKLA
jgi:hypothetical protein